MSKLLGYSISPSKTMSCQSAYKSQICSSANCSKSACSDSLLFNILNSVRRAIPDVGVSLIVLTAPKCEILSIALTFSFTLFITLSKLAPLGCN